MNIVAIDAGFGYMKALVNNKKIKFANIVGNYHFSDNGLLSSGSRDLSIEVENLGAWNFGNTAILQSSGGGSRRQSSDRIFTDEYLASILLAISEGYSSQTREIEVNIITGLPGTEYNRDKAYKAEFRKFIQGDYRIQRSGYKQYIKINSIRWTNQGWGAIWQFLIDDRGNPIRLDTRADKVLIGNLNIGYRTFEIGTVEVSGIQSGNLKVQTAAGMELSEPDGVHRLIGGLTGHLVSTFDKTFTPEQAIEILENGGLILDGNWQDYQLPVGIKDDFSNAIYNHMTKVFDNDTAFLYRFILTGGGANIVNSFNHIPQLIVSNAPQWDSVIGYERLAKLVTKRSK